MVSIRVMAMVSIRVMAIVSVRVMVNDSVSFRVNQVIVIYDIPTPPTKITRTQQAPYWSERLGGKTKLLARQVPPP